MQFILLPREAIIPEIDNYLKRYPKRCIISDFSIYTYATVVFLLLI